MNAKIGDVFGNLTITGFEDGRPIAGKKAFVKCSCGKSKGVRLAHLMSGATVSCGCVKQKFQALPGETFGRLTVIEGVTDRRSGNRKVPCRCSCGKEKYVGVWELANGVTKSCGCLVIEQVSALSFKHGEDGTHLYMVWHGMKARCESPSSGSYSRYGGRGISVCEEWRSSYIKFRNWAVDAGYKKGLQIDRENNDGNYDPSNCRFISPIANANNRGNHVLLTAFGEVKTMSEWARDNRCVVSYETLKARIARGFSHQSAITEKAAKGPHGKRTIQEGVFCSD